MVKQNVINRFTQDLTIDPAAAGDSFIQFDINTGNEFRIGVDDDDADAFKISQGVALGVNDTIVIEATGECTMPLQPAFYAYVSATQSNVTGNGATYTIIPNTEIYDVNGDYDTGTGNFTAPVTGKFIFNGCVRLTGVAAANNTYTSIVTSNRSYITAMSSASAIQTSGGACMYRLSSIADMDAADIAYMTIYSSGEAGDVNDVVGGAANTYFGGYLAC